MTTAALPELLRDADDLRLHIALQAEDRVLAAVAGFLRAAEWHEGRRRAVLVDPGRADFEPGRDFLAALYVAGPDRAAEPVTRVVGAPDRVLEVAVLENGHDRAELLLADEAAGLVDK